MLQECFSLYLLPLGSRGNVPKASLNKDKFEKKNSLTHHCFWLNDRHTQQARPPQSMASNSSTTDTDSNIPFRALSLLIFYVQRTTHPSAFPASTFVVTIKQRCLLWGPFPLSFFSFHTCFDTSTARILKLALLPEKDRAHPEKHAATRMGCAAAKKKEGDLVAANHQ